MIIHIVKQGESIYSIARLYGIPMSRILEYNGLTEESGLTPGQALVIITDKISYTVQRGDSLYTIARKFGTTVQAILEENPQITNPARIQPGQVITVPVLMPKSGSIYVNGYAFPNINRETLERTLPNLTYLSIFSYQVRADGSLSTINDTELIEAARRQRVAPIMVITNIKEGGSFDSELAHQILVSTAVQNLLIENCLTVMQEKNYAGLDVDFEYIYPEDRVLYNNFLRRVTNRLRPMGYTISTALAPKTAANQPGILYEAHDYPVHGALVDHVILMTYEWGYTYSPPRAVAPLNLVNQVLSYAVTEIPREKILMGMPNYGYNWTLPYVQGTAARTVTNTGAVNLAVERGAFIQYDTRAQAPFFNYYEDGKQHEVWFEDARSVQAKLNLVRQYRLGGISVWTIQSYFPQFWPVLQSMFNVVKVL